MKLSTKVLEGRWDEEQGIWNLYVIRGTNYDVLELRRRTDCSKIRRQKRPGRTGVTSGSTERVFSTHGFVHRVIFSLQASLIVLQKWPDIEGLHDFQGPKMHSACWDHSVELEGKTIGVIGNGSSSVQIVPALQPIAKKMQVFMRSSTWISPPFGGGALTKMQKGQDVDPGKSGPKA